MTMPRALEPAEWELWHIWMQAQRLLARELDRQLQQDYGISKAEFSVLVSLHQAAGGQLRVGELADSLAWDKGRVAHQLTRMEGRDLVTRIESGSAGRRTGVALTAKGRSAVRQAIQGHEGNIRRYFFDQLAPEQAAAIKAWSRQTLDRIDAAGDQAGAPAVD
ncbi:MarR family winged helix-turn-helix transcriptional regulator [Actinoplanes sp. L3-i22]|uniref:MarR family winged helix-turn-helix transcriptional regulator n=1 Tax=Actinoplanes sp. L3-i22 TaxID=2836373 RepID=UPI001C756622|nr:MarR family transcriptional regulator [Actinoplanes sp. L3-i22]BCY09176.1 MarR family transcriptional regulator [Actinoplanes sp. L3-i22]